MIAYKFLRPSAVGPFSGVAWPAPARGRPGGWVDAGAVDAAAGVHACRPGQLPLWIADELWVVELAEPVRATAVKLSAPRGRLLARVAGWDPAAAEVFAAACALRTGKLPPGTHGADVERLAADLAVSRTRVRQGGGWPREAAAAGLIAARAAACVGGARAAAQERARQGSWFLRLLLEAAGDAG